MYRYCIFKLKNVERFLRLYPAKFGMFITRLKISGHLSKFQNFSQGVWYKIWLYFNFVLAVLLNISAGTAAKELLGQAAEGGWEKWGLSFWDFGLLNLKFSN